MALSGHFDLPARAGVLEQMTYVGHDSCSFCDEHGDVVKTTGRGHVMTFPFRNTPSGHAKPRDAVDVKAHSYEALGVVKQLVGLWFNSKHSDQRWYCGSQVEMVDKRLLEIKPPTVITRIPRSIQHHVKFWKGNQLMRHKLKLYYLVHLSVSCWVEGESVFYKCKEK